jgi:hypothetical protein
MAQLRGAFAVLSLLLISGCVVVDLHPFYEESWLTYDPRLVGTWLDADDSVTVTVEPSEWRSYRIAYSYPTEAGVLTGYLFFSGDAQYVDLMPIRGQDSGPFLVPMHGVARVVVTADRVTLSPLSYDLFKKATSAAPGPLASMLGERDQIVIASPVNAVRAWLKGRGPADEAFTPTFTFTRQAAAEVR